MSQSLAETEEKQEEKERIPDSESAQIQRQQEAYNRSRGYTKVITTEMRVCIDLAIVTAVFLMAEVVVLGETWLFAPVYVGIAIAYIAGALYLFKKLWTY